jgi:hypothetical protein
MAMKKNAAELLDDIYSLAYWMTGSKDGAHHLVYNTYLRVDHATSAIEVFKTFRNCYLDSFIKGKISFIPQPSCKPMEHLGEELIKQEADVKFTVLLREIAKLKPSSISKIIERPIDTINSWLSTGRAWLAEASLSSNGHGRTENLPKEDRNAFN